VAADKNLHQVPEHAADSASQADDEYQFHLFRLKG
jgi:hypothetical protein